MADTDIDIVERLEKDVSGLTNRYASRQSIEDKKSIDLLTDAAAEIKRLRKIEDVIKSRQEKTKEWCLCEIGKNGDGQHSGYCTAYYSPNHSNLIPPKGPNHDT